MDNLKAEILTPRKEKPVGRVSPSKFSINFEMNLEKGPLG